MSWRLFRPPGPFAYWILCLPIRGSNILNRSAAKEKDSSTLHVQTKKSSGLYWKLVMLILLSHSPAAMFFILFNFANYSPSMAMELKVSKEVTCKWQNQRFEPNKYVSWALFLKLQAAEINFEKLLGWTVFKNPNFNSFQSSSVCPSMESVVSVMLF